MQHGRHSPIVDAVHQVPVQLLGEVGVEHFAARLQRHALIDERSAADAGRAQRRHVLPDYRLNQAQIRVDANGTPEDLRGRPIPQHPPVWVGGTRKSCGVGPRRPSSATFEYHHPHTGLSQPQRRDPTAEARPDDDHAVLFPNGSHSPSRSGMDQRRCAGGSRQSCGGTDDEGSASQAGVSRHMFVPGCELNLDGWRSKP